MAAGRKSPVVLMKWRRPLDYRQAVWDEIRRAEGAFAEPWLSNTAKVQIRTVRSYLQCLVAGGILSSEDGPPRLYRLVHNTGLHAPRIRPNGTAVEQGRGRASAWLAMRVLKRFTVRELHAACGATEVDIKSFCKHLLKAGYLKAAVKGAGGAPSTYLLIRNTGPLPPQVTRIKCVYDQNLGEVTWPTAQVEAEAVVDGLP